VGAAGEESGEAADCGAAVCDAVLRGAAPMKSAASSERMISENRRNLGT